MGGVGPSVELSVVWVNSRVGAVVSPLDWVWSRVDFFAE